VNCNVYEGQMGGDISIHIISYRGEFGSCNFGEVTSPYDPERFFIYFYYSYIYSLASG
jgi:hypothetical protein